MEVTYAYLAGLVDADGCIGINTVTGDRRVPCLSFVNTSRGLIDLFQEELGGHAYIRQHKHPAKPTYEIQIRKPETVIEALSKIEPYLRYKKNKSVIAREYAESVIRHKKKWRTPEIIAEREEIWNKWKSLTSIT